MEGKGENGDFLWGVAKRVASLITKDGRPHSHMSTPLTARQATQIFGWWDPRLSLTWADVLQRKLTLKQLIALGLSAVSLSMIQPNPAQWVEHTGATLEHVRFMQPMAANPFEHFGADLADVLKLELTFTELMRMGVTWRQLKSAGMTDITEGMFKLDHEEWGMLGKPVKKR